MLILWGKGPFREDNKNTYENATVEITEFKLKFEHGTSKIYKTMLPAELI
jgi:hypothetical protein